MTVFSALLLPVGASAADDARIDSVIVSVGSTEVGATEVDYGVLVETSESVDTFSCIFFEGSNPGSSPFSGTPTVKLGSTLTGASQKVYDGSEASDTVYGATITPSSALSPGGHQFTLAGVSNPTTDGTFKVGCTSASDLEGADYTFSPTFDIGEGGSSSVNPFSAISWSVDSVIQGETTDYTLNVTLDSELTIGNSMQFIFQEDGTGAPSDSGVDTSGVSVSASGLSFRDLTVNTGTISLPLDESAAAGTYTVVLQNIVNPDKDITLQVGVTDSPDTSNWLYADEEVTFIKLTAPDRITKSQMSTKKIKKKKANVKWESVANVDTYTVQLRKCKNIKKKKCKKSKHFQKKKKYRKFKGLTATKKTVKKLKKGTYYQWRIRAINDAGKAPWSKWKRFKTKGKNAKAK